MTIAQVKAARWRRMNDSRWSRPKKSVEAKKARMERDRTKAARLGRSHGFIKK